MKRVRFLALTLLLATGCGSPPAQPVVSSADDVEIAYTSVGSSEPALVFVHGWALDRSYWDDQIRRFSSERQTVTIDLAGHGKSGTGRTDWTMDAFGRDVASVVTALDLERVVLVGHSMGGSVVLEAAEMLGEHVAGIVLVDAFHDPDQPMSDDEREGILAAYRADFETNVGSMVRQYLFAPETDSLLAARIATQMSTFDPAAGVASIENLFRSDYRPTFPRIEAPMAAINSALYPTNVESMARYGIEVRTIDGVGHFPMIEAPDRFNEVLRDVAFAWR